MNRRDFIIRTGFLASFFLFHATAKAVREIQSKTYCGPFAQYPGSTQKDFDGDNPDFPHEVLWNKSGYLARFQKTTQVNPTEILIVGGGIGGLTAGYYLQDRSVTLLEQAPQLGGNSKAYAFSGSDLTRAASMGAAYITIPDEGSDIDLFLKDLNLNKMGRRGIEAPVFFKKKPLENFEEALTENEKVIFSQIKARLDDIFENQYPAIPLSQDSKLSQMTLEWDKLSFAEWLENEFGPIPEKILEYYQMYAWSSFAGSLDEISAAQFLNFICAETIGVWAFPGGNAQIVERIYQNVKNRIDIQCGSFVVDIQKTSTGYKTLYTQNNELFQIESKYLVFSAPKFLCDKVLSKDFSEAIKACENIEYRSYLVANVVLKGRVDLPGYDQFILEGSLPPTPTAMKPAKRPFADIVNADWAASMDSKSRTLTLYKPLPYQGARQFLFNPSSYDKHQRIIRNELSQFGLTEDKIESFCLTRWGHALPVSHKNMLASQALKPLYPRPGQTLYFVGQDVYANPAFECAFETAFTSAQFIREQL